MANPEGTVAFWIDHEHENWDTNEENYKFGPFQAEDVSVEVVKTDERKLQVSIAGVHESMFQMAGPVPKAGKEPGKEGIHVAITWSTEVVTLYLNGEAATKVDVPK